MEMDEGIVDSSEHLDKEELAAELGRAKSKISKLKSEIANTKANRKEEMKLFKSELEALKEATKNGTDETELCAKLRKENQELEQKYHALEDRYNETISKRKLADGSNRELEHLNSSLRCINSELEMKIENLSIANKDLEARLMSVGTEKNAIRRDNRRLKEQLSTSTAEHQALKKAHTELTKAHNDVSSVDVPLLDHFESSNSPVYQNKMTNSIVCFVFELMRWVRPIRSTQMTHWCGSTT